MSSPLLPTPPFLNVPGLANLRDIGGYPVADSPGLMIRTGVLFRSAEPSATLLTASSSALLSSPSSSSSSPPSSDDSERAGGIRLSRVYDLRSSEELEKPDHRDPAADLWPPPGARRLHTPVFSREDYSPEALAVRFRGYAEGPEGVTRAYEKILEASAAAAASSGEGTITGDEGTRKAAYKVILEDLVGMGEQKEREKETGSILVHCSAGKDRTGVICAIVLSLCGVADEVVAHEYNLTELGMAERYPAIIARLQATREEFKDKPEGAFEMVRARRESMLRTLAMIREKYGSVEDCVLKTKMLDKEGIEKLRAFMVVPVPSGGKMVNWEENQKLVLQANEKAGLKL